MEIYLDTPRPQLLSKHSLTGGYEIFYSFSSKKKKKSPNPTINCSKQVSSVLHKPHISYVIKHCCSKALKTRQLEVHFNSCLHTYSYIHDTQINREAKNYFFIFYIYTFFWTNGHWQYRKGLVCFFAVNRQQSLFLLRPPFKSFEISRCSDILFLANEEWS